jgi:hypothetical protein
VKTWLRQNWWYIAATILLFFAVEFLYSSLGNYSDSYDSGVYLESARMMTRGFAPYQQIFDSQPPLWLALMLASFRLFGENVFAGQLVTATSGLVTVVAVMLLTLQLGGKGASIIAGIIVIFSPLELEWSRTINADVPSVAFAATSLAFAAAYARNGHRRWLAAASIAATCSILIKLSGVYVIPSLLLFVIARQLRGYRGELSKCLTSLVQDILVIGGIVIGITCLCLGVSAPDQAWNQVVKFHWAARKAYPSLSLFERFRVLGQLLAGERLIVIGAPLAALCLSNGIDGLALIAWPLFTSIGLLDHRPLFDHHMIALIPAAAAAIGVGAGYLPVVYAKFIRWLSLRTLPIRIGGATLTAIASVTVLGMVIRQAWITAANQQAFIRGSRLASPDLRVAEMIAEHTQPGDMIITDAQGIAFLAGRDVPPGLTDTSYVRITSGYLRPSEVIEQAEQFNVRLMLLWTGRLSLMPEVVRWADKRFPHRIDLDRGRSLYIMD